MCTFLLEYEGTAVTFCKNHIYENNLIFELQSKNSRPIKL